MAASSTLAAAANGHQHQRGSEQLPQRKAPPYQPPPVSTTVGAAGTSSQPQSMHSIASNGGGIGGSGTSAGSKYQPTATQVRRQLTKLLAWLILFWFMHVVVYRCSHQRPWLNPVGIIFNYPLRLASLPKTWFFVWRFDVWPLTTLISEVNRHQWCTRKTRPLSL